MSAGLLLAGVLLGCGTLATPPSPVVGTVVEVERALVRDLSDGVSVELVLGSELRRKTRVASAAYALTGLNGELGHVDWTPVEQHVQEGEPAETDWAFPLEGSLDGGLVAQAPFVLSGTLEVHPPGGGRQLVPFTVPALLVLPEESDAPTTTESP